MFNLSMKKSAYNEQFQKSALKEFCKRGILKSCLPTIEILHKIGQNNFLRDLI